MVVRADAGHEITFYPSYYPQEIKVVTASPAAAASLLQKNTLHAYAGPDPYRERTPPAHVARVESLRGYVALTFAPMGGGAFAEVSRRCAAAGRVLNALSSAREEWVFHPYPVTPYHDDYLHHFDLVEAAQKRARMAPSPGGGAAPRIAAKAPFAQALRDAGFTVSDGGGDATLEEVDLSALLAPRESAMNGWRGPPWVKEGWFHAWLLQGGATLDARARATVDELAARRQSAGASGVAERINLERKLVGLLGAGCERTVVGYTRRREAVNVEYSEGVENVAHDAQAGLASAAFIRTVKLKDFPWNGWLRVGAAPSPAAWNPIAGFTDATGRLLWAAVGDPALFPDPDSARWVPNRVRPVSVTPAAEVPADATLRAAGAAAGTRIVYRVLMSTFHDGTRMTVADLMYPYAFASRWGVRGGRVYDPAVDRATATLRARLAGVRVVKVDTQLREVGDVTIMYEVPEVEVYLTGAVDARYAAVVAPPWTVVPWQLTVLMEEAVTRGLAAFSESEARRRRVPWMDLVRDPKLIATLAGLAQEFERRAYVPQALAALVTPEQARQRWGALRAFHRARGHFLDTNGPYRMERPVGETVTLPVYREFTYPLGVGSFDQFPIPLRAYATRVTRRGERVEVQAEVETITKFARSYKVVREPFRPGPATEQTREPLTAHYVLVGGADDVLAAGASRQTQDDRVVIALPAGLPPGAHRLHLALSLNGNLVAPEVTVVPYPVGD